MLERLCGGSTLWAAMQEAGLRLAFLFYKYIFIEHLLYAKHYRARNPTVKRRKSLPL